jgi:hypothetical protein
MAEHDTSLLAAVISKSESIAKDVEELFTLAEQLEQTLGKGSLAHTRAGRTAARAIAASARRDVRALVSVARSVANSLRGIRNRVEKPVEVLPASLTGRPRPNGSLTLRRAHAVCGHSRELRPPWPPDE